MTAPTTSPDTGGEDLLFYKLKDLILEQSEGEWTDAMVIKDAHHFANNLRPLFATPTPRKAEAGSVVVPREQLITLGRSIALGTLLPGEGEALINCWIRAHDAAPPAVGEGES